MQNKYEISLRGLEFEKIVAKIFKGAGYEINEKINNMYMLCDIIAEKDGKKYGVDVKFSFKRESTGLSRYAESVRRMSDQLKGRDIAPVLVFSGIFSEKDIDYLKRDGDIIILDVSNLLYAVEYDQELSNELISFLPFSISDLVPRESFLRINIIKHNSYGESLTKKLEFIQAGRDDFGNFEDACMEMLKYILEDDLALWKKQAWSNKELYRFDCLCRIKSNNEKEFWSILEKYFNTKYIVFEFKNYTQSVTQKEIYTTERYLYAKALRSVAIMVARNGYDSNSFWATKGCLRENGKLIILLTVEDLMKMCQLKDAGEEPAEYLLEKLDNLLIELEK